MIIRHGAASNVGLVRRQNEDSFVAGMGVYAVCDGMGGALAGEVASETACRIIREVAAGSSADEVQAAVARANTDILSQSMKNPSLSGMGTTMTAAVRRGDELLFAHVGDSRGYLLRDGRLSQLTEDHSLVAELVRQGRLTREEAAVHPHRSVITKALGTEMGLEADIIRVPLQVGDRLLLCSDGLSGQVADGQLEMLLGEAAEPQTAADRLIQEALANGGEDNVTVVVLFVEDGDESSEGAAQAIAGPARRSAGRRPTNGLATMRAWLHRHRKPALAAGVVIVVLLLAVAGMAIFNSGVYYVGTYGDLVALYQGMPQTVLGVELYTLVEVGKTAYSALEPHLKARIDAHELTTKEEGQRFLRSLESGI